MITVKPSNSADYLLRFDGEVYEVFWGDKSSRIHVTQISDIKINTNRRGEHELVVTTVVGIIPYLSIDDAAFAQVTTMVGEIQTAKASYKF